MRRSAALAAAVALMVAGGGTTIGSTAAFGTEPMASVVIVLKARPDLSGLSGRSRTGRLVAVERALRAHATRTQGGLLTLLARRRTQHLVSHVVPLWIDNSISVDATPAVIREIAARPDVAQVHPEFTIQAPAAPTPTTAPSGSVEPNVALTQAASLWAQGFVGQNTVVANLDTGVDATHPDLASSWRGGSNSWYDHYGQHATPTDVNGHGTWTMGVMVGGSAGGSAIGVAPGARWIAAKIFDDHGLATSTAIHQSFQWVLDPDANPATSDAPNVVNDSWSMSTSGCDRSFESDLSSLRAAGILPVFAAGNTGPSPGTVTSPANNPEAFAVDATDDADGLYPYSSRGVSPCAGSTAPALAAPGVNIRTSDLYGDYATETGTSLAAPHVAGALALLLGVRPDLTADQQAAALEAGAADLGPAGVDPDYGYGRLDVAAAYRSVASTPGFGVSIDPPSATAAPGATATFTVGVTAVNDFVGDVSLSVRGLAAADGSATLSPPLVAGGTGSATLAVTMSATVAPGNYPLTVTAASGALNRTAVATVTVQAPPDFGVSVSPQSQSVAPGSGATYSVAVSALNQFTGAVALTVAGPPGAVGTATISPSTITAAGTAQLVVTTQPGAPSGNYSLTITATSGSTVHTAAVKLVVRPPPDFTVAVTPTAQTVPAGAVAAYTVTVTAANGFTGAVALSLSGLPAAAGTGSFSPATVAGSGASRLSVATAITAGGSYALTVTATSGTLVHSASATVAVTARDFTLNSSPTSVTVTRGQTASYPVSIKSIGGFIGTVALAVTGLPSGATSTWTSTQVVSPGSSTLRVRTTTSTARGTFALTVTGTSGALSHRLTLTLVVR